MSRDKRESTEQGLLKRQEEARVTISKYDSVVCKAVHGGILSQRQPFTNINPLLGIEKLQEAPVVKHTF